jgi:putative ABC transport system ATP-binding protein
MGSIELRGVVKGYREGEHRREVLSQVDASWKAGERIVLLGRSGSGKSTLLHLLSGLDVPDQGELSVGGYRLDGLSEEARTRFRREHVGFIFQSFNLIPTLTVLENVRFPIEILGRSTRSAGQVATQLLEEVDLKDRAETYPDRLSGGEQQRVAVARALAHDPKLILADEPTGNLDQRSGDAVFSLLHRLARMGNKTLVVVTHDPGLTAGADRVLTLEDGRLTERPRS